ncbi:hypothetical protein HMPREF0604_00717 [Neisseria mucosa C102]|uniref:Uncharacterized protein n=1 Tax=Neisseria mucosa C102 TaxID=435832 RepID=A0ABN0CD41_NEIMU|nr:hypothetical protein HMPREF0604_00717 [Neisseria mucosa C102]
MMKCPNTRVLSTFKAHTHFIAILKLSCQVKNVELPYFWGIQGKTTFFATSDGQLNA